MKQYWRKLGQLYQPSASNRHAKLLSHAANPLPLFIDNDVYRIFYSARDAKNRSSVGAVDIDITTHEVIEDHELPFFEHGPEDSFYAQGVSIGNCYHANGALYMLFMGWQQPKGQHWRGDIGRLVVTPELTLKSESPTPFLTASDEDPISLSYPWVHREDNGNYLMWYGSTITWDAGNQEMLHVINVAISHDGTDFTKHGLAVPYHLGVAQAFSRPTVLKDDTGYHMWFSYRCGTGKSYRIGYANSVTGYDWVLQLEHAGIDVSPTGWDSEMIAYPYVFTHKNQTYLLYNGNGYGQTGFGLAILENL